MAKKMGRPAIVIDKSVFENLCSIQCTEEEIAGVFNCSIDTINRWCKKTYNATFADIYKSKSAKGKMSLRRWQFDTAKRGNATMQIWLGRQYLGQADKQEIDLDATAAITFVEDLPPDEEGCEEY